MIVVVIGLAIAMNISGTPRADVLAQLGGSGVLAVCLLRLRTASPLRAAKMLGAALSAASWV
ncbi:hypothetical protein [Streptomyces sp. YGL11-2]|uniref:hypothetical protein n=1 Tax=Streptomyces sp. YGL11-2 TaxID=3414028 RepID=UPI003CF5B76F